MGSEGIFSLSDTGTTMILLNQTLFKNVVSMIPNAIVHDFEVKVPREHVGGLQTITFVVKGHNLTLTPDQYMLTQWESPVSTSIQKWRISGSPSIPIPRVLSSAKSSWRRFIPCTIRTISVWGLRPRRSQVFLQDHHNRARKRTSISKQ